MSEYFSPGEKKTDKQKKETYNLENPKMKHMLKTKKSNYIGIMKKQKYIKIETLKLIKKARNDEH